MNLGRVIDRASAELQNEGCATFGLSQALFEEMTFDGGQVLAQHLEDLFSVDSGWCAHESRVGHANLSFPNSFPEL